MGAATAAVVGIAVEPGGQLAAEHKRVSLVGGEHRIS